MGILIHVLQCMRKFSLFAMTAFALALVGAGCASAPFATGDKVLANWKGGSRWWEAQVTSVSDSTVGVTYDSDKTTDTLPFAQVSHVPSGKASVKVGDKVAAKWTDGRFYGATVTAVSGDKATVAWTDGSSPMDVALTDMVLQGK